jgi:hypothetical protein
MKDVGLAVIAVDVRNDRSGTAAFYDEFGYEVPNVFDTQNVGVARYGVSATPTTYVVDDAGRIVWRRYGYLPGEEVRLREFLERELSR